MWLPVAAASSVICGSDVSVLHGSTSLYLLAWCRQHSLPHVFPCCRNFSSASTQRRPAPHAAAAPAAPRPERDIHNSCPPRCVRFVMEAHTPARPMTCRVLPPGRRAWGAARRLFGGGVAGYGLMGRPALEGDGKRGSGTWPGPGWAGGSVGQRRKWATSGHLFTPDLATTEVKLH